ncbi:GntR family transcriptional regulator [Dietzia sp. 179-F 9C3 NHS]|uniref:GntR family transcriptional regulator n=1 Tax=Dietzia sp. 179-F 9C3 NHS TaxID=3374295 RepID=UPI00387A1480
MTPTGGARVGGAVLVVDPSSPEAPFRQLREQILEARRRGALVPGTRMPTVRGLAEQVGVAAGTAAKVYRELEAAGVLEGRGRAGTFVADADVRGAALARAADEFAELAASAGASADEACAAVREAFARLA